MYARFLHIRELEKVRQIDIIERVTILLGQAGMSAFQECLSLQGFPGKKNLLLRGNVLVTIDSWLSVGDAARATHCLLASLSACASCPSRSLTQVEGCTRQWAALALSLDIARPISRQEFPVCQDE